jgi:NSS family neurotransmitter:Na+ symporter
MGLGTALSCNVLSDINLLRGTIYQNGDYLTSKVMLPVAGLLITFFAGWVMCRNSTSEELGGAGTSYKAWRLLARYVAPAAIVLVFLEAVGIIG